MFFFLVFCNLKFNPILSQEQCLGYNPLDFSCKTCSDDYYDQNYLFKIENKISETIFSDCKIKNKTSNESISRNVLIAKNLTFQEFFTIFDAIYPDFISALINETSLLGGFYKAKLNIYFSNDIYYILKDARYEKFYFTVFRRINAQIRISPLFCNSFNFSGFCVKNYEMITIFIKTLDFSFFVLYELFIDSIKFDGSDLLLSQTNIISNSSLYVLINQCLENPVICCLKEFRNYHYNNETIQNLCGVNGRTTFSENAKTSNFYSFFILENYFSRNENPPPSIIFHNVIFQDFYVFDRPNFKLIEMFCVGGYVEFQNITFDSFFFQGGILENLQNNQSLSLYYSNNMTSPFYGNYSWILNQSFFKMNLVSFLNVEIFSNNNGELYFFNLETQEFNVLVENCVFENLTNNIFSTFVTIFNILKNTDIQNVVCSFENIIFTNVSYFEFLNFQLDFIQIKNLTTFEIFTKKSFIICFDTFFSLNDSKIQSNQNTDNFIYLQNSIVKFKNVTFFEIDNAKNYFINLEECETSLLEVNFENGKINQDIFLIKSGIFNGSELYFDNVETEFSVFQIREILLFFVQNVIFRQTSISIMIKCFKTNSVIVQEIYFAEYNRNDYFISPGSELSKFTANKMIIENLISNSILTDINNYISVEITDCSIKNVYIGMGLYYFYVSNGQVNMTNVILSDFDVWTGFSNLFEIECQIAIFTKVKLLALNLPPDNLVVWYCCWHSGLVIINSTLCYGSYTLNDPFIYLEDNTDKFWLLNSKFLASKFVPNITNLAINVLGSPSIFMMNNLFINLKCSLSNADVLTTSGVVLIMGLTTFVKSQTNFKFFAENNTFENCSCINGGSLGIVNYNETRIYNLSIIKSSANKGGSIFLMSNYKVEIIFLQIYNSSSFDGSAFFISQTDNIFIDKSSIEFSNSIIGGVITITKSGKLMINEIFIGNSNAGKGGFIKIDEGVIIINNSYFSMLKASLMGGFAYINKKASLFVNNSFFFNSQSDNYAGLIFCELGNFIKIINSKIVSSNAKIVAGAMLVESANYFGLENVNFTNNSCDGNGILSFYSQEGNQKIQIKKCSFLFNKAVFGSVIFFQSSNVLWLSNINCSKNSGILVYLSWFYVVPIFIEEASFSQNLKNNKNNDLAGILFAENVNLTLTGCFFFNNSNNKFLISSTNSLLFLSNLTFDDAFFMSFQDLENNNNQILGGLIFCSNCVLLLQKSFMKSSLKQRETFDFNFKMIYVVSSHIFVEDSMFKEIGWEKKYLISCETSLVSILNSIFKKNNSTCLVTLDSNITIVRTSLELNYFGYDTSDKSSYNNLYAMKSSESIICSCFLYRVIVINFEGNSMFLDNIDSIILHSVFVQSSNNLSFSKGVDVYISNKTQIFVSEFFACGLYSDKGSALKIEAKNNYGIDKVSFVLISNSFFVMCKSLLGGAIFLKGNFQFILKKSLFYANMAKKNNSLSYQTGIAGCIIFQTFDSNYSLIKF